MKRNWLVSVAALAVLSATGSVFAVDDVTNTLHNLSSLDTDDGRICIFCHTPHNAEAVLSTKNVALWNHTTSTQTFSMYSNPATMDMTQAASPQGVSLACLSCHDGVTAMDSMLNGGITPVPTLMDPAGGNVVGTDLSNDHPISVTYDNSLDTAFQSAATVSAVLPLYGVGSNQMECGSCHNPHDNATAQPFLRILNDASALCLTCHIK